MTPRHSLGTSPGRGRRSLGTFPERGASRLARHPGGTSFACRDETARISDLPIRTARSTLRVAANVDVRRDSTLEGLASDRHTRYSAARRAGRAGSLPRGFAVAPEEVLSAPSAGRRARSDARSSRHPSRAQVQRPPRRRAAVLRPGRTRHRARPSSLPASEASSRATPGAGWPHRPRRLRAGVSARGRDRRSSQRQNRPS
jgi:hypothetical protein